ncbi:hypothetical protein [Microbacterium kyungheense]|uniref:Uncharacterized protein n=1 Tax=Microbacterium kyungheense TaxID=1263636 RepID=A0A543FKA5_9MICO|nr:hypothetical protein [Microbacterium kyungheense]TQM34255.1 hypothetical protein FB391_0542 [Microbacterium kyungheense]
MDQAVLIVSIGSFLATAVAAAVAWWQAIASGRLRSEAEAASARASTARDEAVRAQQGAAISLAEANLIAQEALDAQRLSQRPPWGNVERIDDSRYRIPNTSGRTLAVTEVNADTGGNIHVFEAVGVPASIRHGDSVVFFALTGGPTVTTGNAVTIEWHPEGEPEVSTIDTRRF